MKNMGSLFFAWETRGVVKPTTKGAVMDSFRVASCGVRWVHVCDEAEGCFWAREDRRS